jgi:hypothetical protein
MIRSQQEVLIRFGDELDQVAMRVMPSARARPRSPENRAVRCSKPKRRGVEPDVAAASADVSL